MEKGGEGKTEMLHSHLGPKFSFAQLDPPNVHTSVEKKSRWDEWLLPDGKKQKGGCHAQLLSEGDPFRKTHRMSSIFCDGSNTLQRAGPHVVGLTLLVKEGLLSDSTL